MSCSKECVGEGVWLPVLMLVSSRSETLPATLSDVKLCEMHKDFAKLDDFLSPEGWDKMQKHLRENGKGTFVKRKGDGATFQVTPGVSKYSPVELQQVR